MGAGPRRPVRLPPDAVAAHHRLDKIAHLLDSTFRIPGTSIRFGYDAIIGLVPGIGDAVGAGLSAWLIYEAWRIGVPRSLLGRMIVNAAIDGAAGSIPVVGDVFDVVFKANRRNAFLLNQHLRQRLLEREKTRESSRASLRRLSHRPRR